MEEGRGRVSFWSDWNRNVIEFDTGPSEATPSEQEEQGEAKECNDDPPSQLPAGCPRNQRRLASRVRDHPQVRVNVRSWTYHGRLLSWSLPDAFHLANLFVRRTILRAICAKKATAQTVASPQKQATPSAAPKRLADPAAE